jgi:hypothetical protein
MALEKKLKIGYKLVGTCSDKKLYHFFKQFGDAVYKRVKEAKKEEANALAKNRRVIFNYAS